MLNGEQNSVNRFFENLKLTKELSNDFIINSRLSINRPRVNRTRWRILRGNIQSNKGA